VISSIYTMLRFIQVTQYSRRLNLQCTEVNSVITLKCSGN